MSGHLPPGCTQLDCDMAQPGYWDPPQTQVACPHCAGEGVHRRVIIVYEPGCAFPHEDTAEDPCEPCGGHGFTIEDVEPDR